MPTAVYSRHEKYIQNN